MPRRISEEDEGQSNGQPGLESVWRALELLGDRWSFLVLREAFSGVTRYGIFQRNLGIARNVLASRLSSLVERGLLKRVRYRTAPDWYEYRLTRAGFELFPAMVALQAWSDEHLLSSDTQGDLEIHVHTCGERLRPVVVCRCCGEAVTAADVQYEFIQPSAQPAGDSHPEPALDDDDAPGPPSAAKANGRLRAAR